MWYLKVILLIWFFVYNKRDLEVVVYIFSFIGVFVVWICYVCCYRGNSFCIFYLVKEIKSNNVIYEVKVIFNKNKF